MKQLIRDVAIIIGCAIIIAIDCFCPYMAEVDIFVRGIVLSVLIVAICGSVGDIMDIYHQHKNGDC